MLLRRLARILAACPADPAGSAAPAIPVAGGDVGGEFVVTKAENLDERVTGGDDSSGSGAFKSARQ
jgi:hypothetical protein